MRNVMSEGQGDGLARLRLPEPVAAQLLRGPKVLHVGLDILADSIDLV